MRKTILALGLLAPAMASQGFAAEGPVPAGIPHLDHVFVIVMENHAYGQIFNNPNTPFINALAASANLATNFFAIGHPSLTNYLEMTGGSNFGVRSDNDPDWHNSACTTNLASGIPSTDNPATGKVCPISGTGTDAATPAIDLTNEVQAPPGLLSIDGAASVPAVSTTTGKTIADQLIARNISWKSYQEGLPPEGADFVSYSDGDYTNNTDFSKILPALNPPLTQLMSSSSTRRSTIPLSISKAFRKATSQTQSRSTASKASLPILPMGRCRHSPLLCQISATTSMDVVMPPSAILIRMTTAAKWA